MFGACVRWATFKKELSYVDQIKSFDDNISVTSSLSYLQDLLYMGIVAIAYQEPVTVKSKPVICFAAGDSRNDAAYG